ncbi:hypothetical protein [Spirochaeta dissipatitropha]
MPWRLISFILVLVLIMFFIGFNLENRSDISVVFHTFEDIPIFFSMFASFLIGVVLMLPFALGKKKMARIKTGNSTSRIPFIGNRTESKKEKKKSSDSEHIQDDKSHSNA